MGERMMSLEKDRETRRETERERERPETRHRRSEKKAIPIWYRIVL